MIKSGGEWISSLALERAIGDFPEVATCAVVARPDDRWGERPIAVISLAPASSLDFATLQERLAGDFERWQCPDDLMLVDLIPLTSTGKIDKKALRARFSS
jgi:fatty-acyl-CoA synthase